MALHAEETKVVTIDERTIAVDDLPEQARNLVAFYDDWKQRELEARSHLMAMQTAMKGIAQQIAGIVQAAEAEAAAAAAEEATEDGPAANDGEADA